MLLVSKIADFNQQLVLNSNYLPVAFAISGDDIS